MLAKFFGSIDFLFQSHVLNELPIPSFNFKKLNVFEGSKGNDWDKFGPMNFMIK